MSVVLPEPFGPSQADDLARRKLQVDVVERGLCPVALRQAAAADQHVIHFHSLQTMLQFPPACSRAAGIRAQNASISLRQRAARLADARLILCDIAPGVPLGADEPALLQRRKRALHGVRIDTGLCGQLPHRRQLHACRILSGDDAELQHIHELQPDLPLRIQLPCHWLTSNVLLY